MVLCSRHVAACLAALSKFGGSRRAAFLLGDISANGFWLYFPVAFVTKTPVAALVLIALASTGFFTLTKADRMKRCALWVPVIVYFALAVWPG